LTAATAPPNARDTPLPILLGTGAGLTRPVIPRFDVALYLDRSFRTDRHRSHDGEKGTGQRASPLITTWCPDKHVPSTDGLPDCDTSL
jgi:hypothetical protein